MERQIIGMITCGRNIFLVVMVMLIFGASSNLYAVEGDPFEISCEDIKRVSVLWGEDHVSEAPVIDCFVRLTYEAGDRLDRHKEEWFGVDFPIVGNMRVIKMEDSTSRSFPPKFHFAEKSWAAAKAKFMAICPQRMDELPDEVFDGNFYKFWVADPIEREKFKGDIPSKKW